MGRNRSKTSLSTLLFTNLEHKVMLVGIVKWSHTILHYNKTTLIDHSKNTTAYNVKSLNHTVISAQLIHP